MNLNLEKIKPTSWAMIVLTFFVTVVPGCLFVFLFQRSLFLELETFKLVVLALGVTLPFFIANSLMYVIWEGGLGESTDSNGFQTGVLAGSIFTIPVVYFPIVLEVFVGLSSKQAILAMVAFEVVIFLGILYLERPREKK